ncbi:UNVERIFIED_CONTAM: hypothetical protein Sradi_2796200 [Sesamum radiatum]|uniref:Separase n=1 Tax=Sesamum radiatum TaxID=300843 RepID=A0AAW2RVZ2_SESRA
MDAELRKSIFDYFVQVLEYLLADLNKYVQSDGEAESVLFNVSSILRSINNLLFTFICDKIYLRTEDTSDGASRNFLRLIYTTVMSFSAKTAHEKTLSVGSDEKSHRELLISVRKELIASVHHLLNIEYEVVGGDLESLWTMILSSATCCYSSKDVLGQPLLSSEILSLGCRLFDLYSELRQVDALVFALCRAVRHSLSLTGSGEAYIPSCSCPSYSNSLSMLLGSLQFRLSFSKAIKSIPEGQAAGCIRQLSSDIMESLEWMKCGHRLAGLGEMSKSHPHSSDSLQFHFREELLNICIQDSVVLCSSLVYLLNAMAIKRLVELHRLIQSSKHMLQRNQSETELKDDADLSSCRKRIRKWRKYVQELTEEAAGLTEFIMGVVSSIVGTDICSLI